jgi:hypothetical protein
VEERKRLEAEQSSTKKRNMFTAFAEALLKKIKKIMIAKKRANLRKSTEIGAQGNLRRKP